MSRLSPVDWGWIVLISVLAGFFLVVGHYMTLLANLVGGTTGVGIALFWRARHKRPSASE
jgi:uncharacterized membrane protein